MRKFLIASHGTLAKGIHSSLELIVGPMENVYLIQAYVDKNKTLEQELEQILKFIDNDDELVVFTDLMGGSVTNQVLQITRNKNTYVVAGFNLPLLLDIMMADHDAPIHDVIHAGIRIAREQMVFVNELLNKDKV